MIYKVEIFYDDQQNKIWATPEHMNVVVVRGMIEWLRDCLMQQIQLTQQQLRKELLKKARKGKQEAKR